MNDIKPIRDILPDLERMITAGRRRPYVATMMPVLRIANGKCCIAECGISYTHQDLIKCQFNRPDAWAMCDLADGGHLMRFDCRWLDFSDAPFDRKYVGVLSLPDNVGELLQEFDAVRESIIRTGVIPKKQYALYLNKVIESTPVDLRKFITDLSEA